jgi:MFS family permease
VPALRQIAGYLRGHARLYTGLFLGAGLIQAICYAYAAWGAELLRRGYGWSIEQAGFGFGAAGLLAGFGGTLAAPIIVRAFERAGRTDAVALTSLAGLGLGTIAAVLAPLQASGVAFLVLQGLSSFCLIGATNNVLVALQTLAPPRMRATLVALLLMCITLLGLGVGPTATALISGLVNPQGASLGLALSLLAPLIAVPAFAFLLWCRGPLGRQWPAPADPRPAAAL